MKDFFTPLKLESMFEPPPLKQTEFTFQAPIATSTPIPPVPQTPANKQLQRVAAAEGTPLKLFQFTYDTYTREHLSAMVDSIAVVPSGSASPPGTRLRSAKRVKLSPASDFVNSDVGVTIGRPVVEGGKSREGGESRRDWRERAAEAKAIMDDIRKGDWSTMSSRFSVATPPAETSGGAKYANVRNEAASLMAAIKKRVFSGGSDVEASYYHEPEQEEQPPAPTRVASASSLLRVPSASSQATTASSAFGGTTTSDSSRPSVPSYTKHPGQPPNHMTTIRPADVREALVERVGDMVFDRARGVWVREGEESFTFDDGEDSDEHEPSRPGTESQTLGDSEGEEEEEEEETNDLVAAFPMPPESRPLTPENTHTITPPRSSPPQPVSVLKTKTHTTRLKRRSVSFSDGRRDGPIVGLESESDSEVDEQPAEAVSARSRRLERLVDDLALDESEEELNFGVASRSTRSVFLSFW